ncbi:thioredoxin family protein [Niallia sp. NCCP-28]|uniref:thioredoxin family protein n=1 Tax=Niallia sp. NCCP-28 TaxID=2934712 RepID=UPI002081A569|nr:thioredoxin family protein [Niallia sp. NCCP-28]GKU83217.1 thiol reductase thioredoxin [Niallia sp. NCCP-28]
MNNWPIEQINSVISGEKEQAFMLYLYTPLCGTCQVASKMLTVVEAMVKNGVFAKIDLNYYPALAEKYEVESVPCLLIFKEGNLLEKKYAFHSVPYLLEEIQKYT